MTATATPLGTAHGAWLVARREIRDQSRDWRILLPILLLTLFFPLLMNFTARLAIDFVNRYGAPLIAERLIPFLLMVVGFFPISISLVIALETFAGERERLSIEPLLVTPLSNTQLYAGKMLASVVAPLLAAYLGIFVYTAGLVWRVGWSPPAQLMAQVIALTTAQALVMVAGAVVISSLTTSVRAANLLASFIIIPVAELMILESLIMFWGRYSVLWMIVVGLVVTVVLLLRMGMHLFSREELLGRELDVLSPRWIGRVIRTHFVAGARSIKDWYSGLFRSSLIPSWPAILLTSIILVGGYVIGLQLAQRFPLPRDLLNLNVDPAVVRSNLESLGFLAPSGWSWVFFNNVRTVLAASLLGAFTFGVLGLVLLMASIVILGYLAGCLAVAGLSAGPVFAALVLPHALLEIPAVVIAGAAILRWGMVVISPAKGRSLGEQWLKGLAEWARLTLGIVVPLLALAAGIEVFLTPLIALKLLFGG